MTYKKILDDLEADISFEFYNILDRFKEIIIFDEDKLDKGHIPYDFFERRNETSGLVTEVHILKVNKNGIRIVNSNDYSIKRNIRFIDLASTYDRIRLLELIKEKIKGFNITYNITKIRND